MIGNYLRLIDIKKHFAYPINIWNVLIMQMIPCLCLLFLFLLLFM